MQGVYKVINNDIPNIYYLKVYNLSIVQDLEECGIKGPSINIHYCDILDPLCGLVVRVPGYRSRGPGTIPGTTRFPEKQCVWNGVYSAS
jgi:hypothetical protein